MNQADVFVGRWVWWESGKFGLSSFNYREFPTINPAETTILRLTSNTHACVEGLRKSVIKRFAFENFTSPMTTCHLFEKKNRLF